MVSSSHHATGAIPPNMMLQGRYLIVRIVGRGGMGAVYEAVDTAIHPNRRVAIKEMSQSGLGTADELKQAKRRFRREADMLRGLDHPNLPRVYHFFEEGDRSFLIMDFIDGMSLFQMLIAANGPLPLPQVLAYAYQLCNVLDYLHRQYPPIIFRDLKPSNVMVRPDGRLFLVDFGIARVFKASGQQDTEYFYSAGFSAPELYRQEQSTQCTDLYSLGATIYCCLTARNPADNKPTMFDFPPLRQYVPGVPVELEQLVRRLVQVDIHQRPKSADEVRQQLLTIMNNAQGLTQRGNTLPPTVPAYPQPGLPGQTGNGHVYWPGGPISWPGQYSGSTRPVWVKDLTALTTSFLTWCATLLFPGLLMFFKDIGIWLATLLTAGRWPRGAQPVSLAALGIQVKNGVVRGYENVALVVSSWSSPVLTPRFVGLLVLRLALVLVALRLLGGIFSNVAQAFGLTLLLLVTVASASVSTKIRDSAAKNLLFCTALLLLVACFALQATPDVQKLLREITFGQLLAMALVSLSLVALVRTQHRWSWVDKLAMALIVATCVLLQFALGFQELLRIPQITLSHTTATLFNDGLVALLVLFTLLFLFGLARPFSGFDRFMLLVVACSFGALQLTLGYGELQHLAIFAARTGAPTGRSSNLAYADLLVFFIPLLGACVALFKGHRFEYLNRVAIFLLAGAIALLEAVATRDVRLILPSSPPLYPLMNRVMTTFTFNQVAFYGGLLVASLLLLIRIGRVAVWIERSAMYLVAYLLVSLQLFLAPKMLRWPFSGSFSSAANVDILLAFHQLVALALLFALIIALVLIVSLAFVRLFRHIARLNTGAGAATAGQIFTNANVILRLLDRLIISGNFLIFTLLVVFLGKQSFLFSYTISSQGVSLPVVLVPICLLGMFTIVALVKLFMAKSFNRWDAWSALLALLLFAMLVYRNAGIQVLSLPLLLNTQQVMSNLTQGKTAGVLLFAGLVGAALLSFLWLWRTPGRDRVLRFIMFLLFFGALLFILWHYAAPALLLTALVLLLLGMFVVIQMERVR